MGQERELKLDLTAAEAQRLVAQLPPPFARREQRNHYLDSPAGELRRRQCGARLRAEECGGASRYTLTIKGPSHVQDGVAERFEAQREIGADEARQILSRGASLGELQITLPPALTGLSGDTPLRLLGYSDNERCCYRLSLDGPAPHELQLELDRTRYPDGSGTFELEVEETGDARLPLALLRAWLQAHGIGWHPSQSSKFARFLARGGVPEGRISSWQGGKPVR